MFWWEEGYRPEAKQDDASSASGHKRACDGLGAAFMQRSLETKVHHLSVRFSPKLMQVVTLDDCSKHDTRVRVRDAHTGEMISEFEVHPKSGFIALSGDATLVAVGVVKEDTVAIYELETGDLLVELDGGRKKGFWGEIQFLPGSNDIVELRSIDYERGVSKRSILRRWNLGFSNRRDPTGDDRVPNMWFPFRPRHVWGDAGESASKESKEDGADSDEEVEEKKWEIELPRGPTHMTYRRDKSASVVVAESDQSIKRFDGTSGQLISDRKVSSGGWTGKGVFSPDYSLFALSRNGFCSIHDSNTGAQLGEVRVPEEPFPITPLGFLHNAELLVLRINLDKTVVVCEWRNPKPMLVLRNFGGTTSDSCSISPDSRFLICWPHGELEFFDMQAIVHAYFAKSSRLKRYSALLLRHLYLSKRAGAASLSKGSPFKLLQSTLEMAFRLNDSVFRYIVEMI
jgi:hypothetical protein